MSAKIVPIAAAGRQGGRTGLRSSLPLPAAGSGVPDSFADLPIEFLLDVDPDELQEFLGADDGPVVADPVFKETLRRRLWTMFCARLPAARPTPPRR